MMKSSEYHLVRKDMLPDVLRKVMDVKRLIDSGEAASVNAACRSTGISRSSYYKYRNAVLAHRETKRSDLWMFVITLEPFPGALSQILQSIDAAASTIISIQQGQVLRGLTTLTITIDLLHSEQAMRNLRAAIASVHGVRQIEVMRP